jgi:heat shock protein HslJ
MFAWNVVNVDAIYFYPDGAAWEDNPAYGQEERQACPDSTTTYFLRVVKRDDSVETRQITVRVEQPIEGPRIVQFQVTPPGQLPAGECVHITWDVQGSVSRIIVRRDDTLLWNGAPLRASTQDCPPGIGQVRYTVEATGPGGVSRASVVIDVVSPPSPTATATQTPTTAPSATATATQTATATPTATTAPPTATATPEPQDALDGTAWEVYDIEGTAPLTGSLPITVSFQVDSAVGTVSGSGGCNTYSASYQASDDKLAIGEISTTQKSCEAEIMAQEQAFLAALGSAATFEIVGEQMTIWDDSGTAVLKLDRLQASSE